MNQELSVELECVVLNGNIEKWLEKARADIVKQAVRRGDKFVEIGGEFINTFSIVGIFKAETMAEKIRRRNGDWQCEHGEWWRKDDRNCDCGKRVANDQRAIMALQVEKRYGITDR
jgi:hypothetical protein